MKKEEIKQIVEKLLENGELFHNYRDGKISISLWSLYSNEMVFAKPYKLNLKNPNLTKVNLIFKNLEMLDKMVRRNFIDNRKKYMFSYDVLLQLKKLNENIKKLNLPNESEIPNYVSADSYEAYLEFVKYVEDNDENYGKFTLLNLRENLNKDYQKYESKFKDLEIITNEKFTEYIFPLVKKVKIFCKELCLNYFKEKDENLEEDIESEVKKYLTEHCDSISSWYSSYYGGKCDYKVSEEKIDELVNKHTKKFREMHITLDKELNVLFGYYDSDIAKLFPSIEIEVENKWPSYSKIIDALNGFKWDYSQIYNGMRSFRRRENESMLFLPIMLFYNNLDIIKRSTEEFMNKVGRTNPKNKSYSRLLEIIKENEEKMEIINSIQRNQSIDKVVNIIKDLGFEENKFNVDDDFKEIVEMIDKLDSYFKRLSKKYLNEDVDQLYEYIDKVVVETVTSFYDENKDYFEFQEYSEFEDDLM